jgi:hypothetical protein
MKGGQDVNQQDHRFAKKGNPMPKVQGLDGVGEILRAELHFLRMALPYLRGYSRPPDSLESSEASFRPFVSREERGNDCRVQEMDASLAGAWLRGVKSGAGGRSAKMQSPLHICKLH